MATAFYSDLSSLLKGKGYDVAFDDGAPMTSPNEAADVWIGHSRGIDRLQYAPARIATIALETAGLDSMIWYADESSRDRRGRDPRHYQLSERDILHIAGLPNITIAQATNS
jgi:hypothetical protein